MRDHMRSRTALGTCLSLTSSCTTADDYRAISAAYCRSASVDACGSGSP